MVKVNRLLDFAERVAWTAIQAGAASLLVSGFTGEAWKIAGAAAAIAALKVIVAQRVGSGDAGAAIPGQVIEPPPTA